ncbi:MAG TPA: tetratricopeptide repeat protein [Bacteroidia bacterium]|nr:tetratricopeptide repeat protein [Bacteroidia bacterium]HNT80277.1 tetratricopeptide repeat protein [Bacteroidia bacterium]
MAEKEQEFDVQEALGKTEQYIQNNKKSLSIIGGAIVVIVLGYFGYTNFIVKPQEEAASKQMFIAERYFEQDSIDVAINGDGNFPGFLQIIQDYGSSESANRAHYYLGMCYLKKGQFEDAIKYLKGYDAEDQITGALALGGIADAYLEQGKTDDAISYYKKAVDWDENDFTPPFFLKKMALTYEHLKQYDKAIDTYQQIKDSYTNSTEGREADKYLARAKKLAGK